SFNFICFSYPFPIFRYNSRPNFIKKQSNIAMIEFQGLTVRMNANVLIDRFSFSVAPKMRIGLVGKNGTGKTTLFNTILGRLEPDKGDIQIPKSAVMAEVAQEITNTELTAFEYILSGDEELVKLREDELIALEAGDGMKI